MTNAPVDITGKADELSYRTSGFSWREGEERTDYRSWTDAHDLGEEDQRITNGNRRTRTIYSPEPRHETRIKVMVIEAFLFLARSSRE